MPPRKKPVEEDVTTVTESEEVTEAPVIDDSDIPQDLLDLLTDEEEAEPVDVEDAVAPIEDVGRTVMVKMLQGTAYGTPDLEWTKEDPFQLMNPIEAERLIKDLPERFAIVTKEQVQEFYNL